MDNKTKQKKYSNFLSRSAKKKFTLQFFFLNPKKSTIEQRRQEKKKCKIEK